MADSTWDIQHGRPEVETLHGILAGGAKGCSSTGHQVLLPTNGDTCTAYNTNTSSFIYPVLAKLLQKVKSNRHE